MTSGRTLRIAHLYPELLNLYGDSGNILVLKSRMAWRGIEPQVMEVHVDDRPSFSGVDIVFIGGGSDREQKIVCDKLLAEQAELKAYVEDGGVLGAVCGGYQLLGESYLMGDEKVPGLELVDLYTDRGEPRLIGNIARGYGISQGTPSKSKGISELCATHGFAMPDWFQRGMEAARLAPTAFNRQRFVFTLSKDQTEVTASSAGAMAAVNLGIAECHFELASGHSVSGSAMERRKA